MKQPKSDRSRISDIFGAAEQSLEPRKETGSVLIARLYMSPDSSAQSELNRSMKFFFESVSKALVRRGYNLERAMGYYAETSLPGNLSRTAIDGVNAALEIITTAFAPENRTTLGESYLGMAAIVCSGEYIRGVFGSEYRSVVASVGGAVTRAVTWAGLARPYSLAVDVETYGAIRSIGAYSSFTESAISSNWRFGPAYTLDIDASRSSG